MPGRYVVRDHESGHEGSITVRPADPNRPLRPSELEPVQVRLRSKGFDPDRIELQPTQGHVYQIGEKARLTIRLEERGDGGRPEKPIFSRQFGR